MPTLNFQKQFVSDVMRQRKRNTIREMRKRPFKVGDRLYMYTGPRMKPEKIGEADVLRTGKVKIFMGKDDARVVIEWDPVPKKFGPAEQWPPTSFTGERLRVFAFDDGFKKLSDFFFFFLPRAKDGVFEGQYIFWGDSFQRQYEEPKIGFTDNLG